MTNIEFEPVTHTYKVNGVVYDSVTQILDIIIDKSWFSDEAARRGDYVHKATDLYDKGDLDEGSLDGLLKPYIDAYKSFLSDTGFIVTSGEERVFNDVYGYCGTLDRRGLFPDSSYPSIVDIKSGAAFPWHGAQLAGYALCFKKPHLRYCLYLHDTGKYKLVKMLDRNDVNIFLACLTINKHMRGVYGK